MKDITQERADLSRTAWQILVTAHRVSVNWNVGILELEYSSKGWNEELESTTMKK